MQFSNVSTLFPLVKSLCIALVTSLALSLLFALFLHACPLKDKGVYAVNQVCKTLSIALGVLLCIKGERGWLQGGVVGLLFTFLSYLVFAAIGGDFGLSWLLVVELLAGVFSGMLSGIIAVNVRRS